MMPGAALASQAGANPGTRFADVVVYGGTAAGVIAAVQVSRLGKRVLLLAPERQVGGISVDGLGASDINNHWFQNDYAVGGLAREFYLRVGRKYGSAAPVYRFESSVAESVFEDLLREASVAIVRGVRLREPLPSAVDWGGQVKRVRAIRMESGETFSGSIFIDATMEGDLLAAARITTASGREGNSLYGETTNGIRGVNDFHQFTERVDPYRIPGDPSSGLIPTIKDESLGEPGAADRRIMGFGFRLCLTRETSNHLPIGKPSGYDPGLYEVYRRYALAGGKLPFPAARLPNGKTDLNGGLYGMNHDWPEGSYATRKRIFDEHKQFTHGLVWFMANDPKLPESVRSEWRGWGLCQDEFSDNNGWPRQLYVRCGRRLVSDYMITEHHTLSINPEPVADPVAVAFWPPDLHAVRCIVRDGAAYNEGYVFHTKGWGPFGISYRALTPREDQALNILTPTCPSSSYVAYGAIRLEWTFMALGQAAATAAATALEQQCAVQAIKYKTLKERLLKDDQVLTLNLVPAIEK